MKYLSKTPNIDENVVPAVFEMPPPKLDVAPSVLDGEIKKTMMYDNISAPQILDEAWMKYIIEFHLPKDLEHLIIMYLKPLVDLAPKSNIQRKEITMHLIEYDLIWDSYFIYMRKGKYDPTVKNAGAEAIEKDKNLKETKQCIN